MCQSTWGHPSDGCKTGHHVCWHWLMDFKDPTVSFARISELLLHSVEIPGFAPSVEYPCVRVMTRPGLVTLTKENIRTDAFYRPQSTNDLIISFRTSSMIDSVQLAFAFDGIPNCLKVVRLDLLQLANADLKSHCPRTISKETHLNYKHIVVMVNVKALSIVLQ